MRLNLGKAGHSYSSLQRPQAYKKLTMELQRSDIASLTHGAKLAFFINVYNALVIHGTVERGRPGNMYSR